MLPAGYRNPLAFSIRMTFLRPRLLPFLACGLFGHAALAQDSTGGSGASSSSGSTSPSGSTGGASSSFGTPSAGSGADSYGPKPPSSTTTPTSPSFRTGESPAPGTGSDQTGTGTGAASSFGTDQAGTGVSHTPPASFSVPGLYGRGAQEFVVGEGRLARPRFRYHGNLSTGYDDNVFQTPTHPQSQPEQKVQVLIKQGTASSNALVNVPSGDPLVPDSQEVVEIPGEKPKFQTIRVPGIPPPERIGSFVTRASAGWDIQLASRRDLFTFDFDAGTSYYWDRPGKKSEYNGTLSLIYLRKLTGRAQFTATVNASYQSQPDFAIPNQPTVNNRGSYLTADLKADLSYRLTPRFSSVTSIAYNSLYSVEKTQQNSDYGETTFGTELRYLFSPRLTLLGEVRYESSMHQQDAAQDTTTYFVLFGGELTLTRRFTSSLRVGESVQSYTESGKQQSSPHVEATLDYRLARGTTVQWNGRYGYEESGSANVQTIVTRSGLALTQIFSPRLQASLSLNLVHTQNSTTTQVVETQPAAVVETPAIAEPAPVVAPVDPAAPVDETTPAPAPTPAPTPKPKKAVVPKTKTVVVETTQDTVDATLGLHYTMSRHWSFNLSYTYTMVIGPEDFNDYYRQQIFLGAEFQF